MERFESLLNAFERADMDPWEVLTMPDTDVSHKLNRSIVEIARFREEYLKSIPPPRHNTCSSEPLSTGVACIDELLGGGLFPGTVTEVFGSAGSGKTCLCSQIALANPGTVYCLTEDPPQLICKRMEDIVAANHGDTDVLRTIRFKKLGSCDALRVLLKSLKYVRDKPPVVIIDSITPVLHAGETSRHREAQESLHELGLRKVAFEVGCAIVYANQVRDSSRTSTDLPVYHFDRQKELVEGDAGVSEYRKKPFMGYALSDYIDSRLMLIRPQSLATGARRAYLHASRLAPPGVVHLQMGEGGLSEGEEVYMPERWVGSQSSQNSLVYTNSSMMSSPKTSEEYSPYARG